MVNLKSSTMAASTGSTSARTVRENPKFNNPGRGADELRFLLMELGEVNRGTPLSQARRDIADAIETHARNAQDILLEGIESIGQMMTLVANGEVGLDRRHVSNMGLLLSHLAVETLSMREAEADMACLLRNDGARLTKEAA